MPFDPVRAERFRLWRMASGIRDNVLVSMQPLKSLEKSASKMLHSSLKHQLFNPERSKKAPIKERLSASLLKSV
ncbi:MAG: hypothetical protein Q8L78_05540 [Coxiellaceae bacterium]|nr:hypothetical protein [Coxiellaceae bacterium]